MTDEQLQSVAHSTADALRQMDLADENAAFGLLLCQTLDEMATTIIKTAPGGPFDVNRVKSAAYYLLLRCHHETRGEK